MTTELSKQLRATLGAAYVVERELNGGGMSRVFLAADVSLGRRVVVKVVSPDLAGSISLGRFEREIAMAAQLQHPHVVPVLSAGRMDDGLPYYTMPYIEGASLRARLDAGPLRLAEAVGILRDVTKALAYAHEHGVVHRDIKPENVLLAGGSAVVSDFGIAKALHRAAVDQGAADVAITLTHLGVPLGSPPYMAPEQISSDPDIDHRADLYSLGVVAYEMLAGRHPFAGLRGCELMAAHLATTPAPLELFRPDVPPALASLVAHLLRKWPADRPRDAAEVLERLNSVVAPDGTPPRRRARTPEEQEASERRRILLAAASVLLALAGVGASLGYVLPARTPVRELAAGSVDVASLRIESLAVLPFVNVGHEATDEYFSDGMTDELIRSLGKVHGLRVAGRSSSFAFKGTSPDAREAGARLRVAAVLEGSVLRVGTTLRVTARLVKVGDGRTLWAETYERDMKDVFKVQDELARAVAGALRVELDSEPDAPLVRRPTRDLQAYDFYLKGRYVWNQRTATSLERAAHYFEAAVARDPAFAKAYAGLAGTYLLLPRYGSVAPADAWAKARAAAERALELDSTLAEAHATLAFGKMIYDRDAEGAERGFRRALKLNPSYATGHQWYGDYLVGRGQGEEGSRELRRAQELDPLSPVIGSELGWSLYVLRRYDEAIAQLQETLLLNPDFATAHVWLGVSYLGKGMGPEAIAELRRAVGLGGRNPEDVATLGYAYALSGHKGAAVRLLVELEERAKREYIAPSAFGIIYTGLGEKGRAFTWLNAAVDRHDTRLVDLLIDPRFDPLRSDARFAQLRQRVGAR